MQIPKNGRKKRTEKKMGRTTDKAPVSGQTLHGVTDIEAPNELDRLPERIARYGEAKKRSFLMAKYLDDQYDSGVYVRNKQWHQKIKRNLGSCCDYLEFHDYFTVGKVRLAKMHSCKIHLMCALCAILRGAKQVRAYNERLQVILDENPDLVPWFVTLSIVNGDDLLERYEHLTGGIKNYNQRRRNNLRGNGSHCEFSRMKAAVYTYEVTKPKTGWHPHIHILCLLEKGDKIDFPSELRPKKYLPHEWSKLSPAQKAAEKRKWDHYASEAKKSKLSQEWKEITGDSFIVEAHKVEGDIIETFQEVFKYALKFGDLEKSDNLQAYELLSGKRMLGSFGLFRGVKVPESMSDQLLDDLPYIKRFYQYCYGVGYSLEDCEVVPGTGRQDLPIEEEKIKSEKKPDPLVKLESQFMLKSEKQITEEFVAEGVDPTKPGWAGLHSYKSKKRYHELVSKTLLNSQSPEVSQDLTALLDRVQLPDEPDKPKLPSRSRSEKLERREDNRAIMKLLQTDQDSKLTPAITEAERIRKYQIYVEQLETLVSGHKLDLIDRS